MSTPLATVLVVDDMPANRLVFERHLELLGHHVLTAEDGRQALEIVRTQAVDLVLLDLMMPVMNGYEALSEIKSDLATAHLPVVIISALNDVESVARCVTLGADDFLFKPVDRLLLEARVAASLARKRAHDRERVAYAAVEAANQAKVRFIALVSHELRGLITGVVGYADLLLQYHERNSVQEQHQYLRAIHGIGARMTAVLEDLGDLSRIESGQLQLNPGPLSLHGVAASSISAIQNLLEAKGHSLQIELDAGLPAIWADELRLSQVLINLLSNACKYTPEGGQISLEARQLSPLMVAVTVRDSGIGIPLAEQARIFEPFFRANDPQVMRQPGTGLGLSLSRQLIELQGGTIHVASAPGQGAAFTFTMLAATSFMAEDTPLEPDHGFSSGAR